MIETAGASLLYLPPYSPDFNPIENAFAKLKALLHKAAELTLRRRPLERNWPHHRLLHPDRTQKLLRRRRIRCNMTCERSSPTPIQRGLLRGILV